MLMGRRVDFLGDLPHTGISSHHNTMNLTASDRAVLRRSAARWSGTCLPASIGGRLRLAHRSLTILRDRSGNVAGFGKDGFVLTPAGWGLYYWGEERQRQAQINGG